MCVGSLKLREHSCIMTNTSSLLDEHSQVCGTMAVFLWKRLSTHTHIHTPHPGRGRVIQRNNIRRKKHPLCAVRGNSGQVPAFTYTGSKALDRYLASVFKITKMSDIFTSEGWRSIKRYNTYMTLVSDTLMIKKLILLFVWTRYSSKFFTCIISFNLLNTPWGGFSIVNLSKSWRFSVTCPMPQNEKSL